MSLLSPSNEPDLRSAVKTNMTATLMPQKKIIWSIQEYSKMSPKHKINNRRCFASKVSITSIICLGSALRMQIFTYEIAFNHINQVLEYFSKGSDLRSHNFTLYIFSAKSNRDFPYRLCQKKKKKLFQNCFLQRTLENSGKKSGALLNEIRNESLKAETRAKGRPHTSCMDFIETPRRSTQKFRSKAICPIHFI